MTTLVTTLVTFVVVPIVVGLLTVTVQHALWRRAIRIAKADAKPGTEDDLPDELAAVRGDSIFALWVAYNLRREAADLHVPHELRRVTAATRSTSRIARLWLPTAVGASALTFEIPLLLLVAAHVDSAGVTVTGVALALAIIIAIDAGPLALTTTSASSSTHGWPRQAVWCYALAVGATSCALLAVVWTGMLGNPLRFSDPTWDTTLEVLRALMFAPLLVALRRHYHGYLMLANKTGWVVWATLARTMTSVLLATFLSVLLDAGATGIGVALTAGVAIEAGIVAFGDGKGAAGVDSMFGRWRDLVRIAKVHLPLGGSTLLAVVPASAVLGGLALSDGSDRTLWAWLVVFIGPSLIASLTLDIEAITAAKPEEPAAGTLAFALVLGVVLTALWLVLADNARIDSAVVTWLVPFPLLCVAREWLRGTLIARARAARTIPALAAGSLTLVFAFVVGLGAGLEPMSAVALAISVGAAAETFVLALFWRRRPSDAAPVLTGRYPSTLA